MKKYVILMLSLVLVSNNFAMELPAAVAKKEQVIFKQQIRAQIEQSFNQMALMMGKNNTKIINILLKKFRGQEAEVMTFLKTQYEEKDLNKFLAILEQRQQVSIASFQKHNQLLTPEEDLAKLNEVLPTKHVQSEEESLNSLKKRYPELAPAFDPKNIEVIKARLFGGISATVTDEETKNLEQEREKVRHFIHILLSNPTENKEKIKRLMLTLPQEEQDSLNALLERSK